MSTTPEYVPIPSRFGPAPPAEEKILRAFFGGSPFLISGPSKWNVLGLGSTSLFAETLVYNTKRSGRFLFAGQWYLLRRVLFPDDPSPEYFVIDLFQQHDMAGVRKRFADTALWLGSLTTGEDGKATAKFVLPENLTTWKVNVWSMSKDTRVGQSSTSAVTTKDLLVRLQAPRFFPEYDEVVISANVHNYPYGCTEQTVSRFLPAVLTLKTLQNMGIKLEDVREIRRGRMEETRKIEQGEGHSIYSGYADLAIFDDEKMQDLIKLGLARISSMQNGDGGWGWWKRNTSSPYLTAYVLHALVNAVECDVAVDQNMVNRGMQYLEENSETRVAHFRTPQAGWWYWWNNDIETNAWMLRAIVLIEPKSDVAPRVVKWLLNNRRNGYYWRSTRDTTLCVSAMSDFVAATGEGEPDYTPTLDLDDGAVVKKVAITKDNFFTYDNQFTVEGVSLKAGRHTLAITREGKGAVYAGTHVRYFTKEEHITAAGHEFSVERTYFKLERIPYDVEVMAAAGQKVMEKRLRYERVPLMPGAMLKSGDLIQVELKITSDNDYTYFAIEDMKPVGCEPVDVRSGGKAQEGFWSYMELRDEKVVFFASRIDEGEHLLRYRLRAEIPGIFHALPTRLFGMYFPELAANSEEMLLEIED